MTIINRKPRTSRPPEPPAALNPRVPGATISRDHLEAIRRVELMRWIEEGVMFEGPANCTNCGAPLDWDAVRCDYCGVKHRRQR